MKGQNHALGAAHCFLDGDNDGFVALRAKTGLEQRTKQWPTSQPVQDLAYGPKLHEYVKGFFGTAHPHTLLPHSIMPPPDLQGGGLPACLTRSRLDAILISGGIVQWKLESKPPATEPECQSLSSRCLSWDCSLS